MKQRVLIVLNGRYPYEKSEDFLAQELKYVNGFDRIICIPILVYGKKSEKDVVYDIAGDVISYFNPRSSYLSSKKILAFLPRIFYQRRTYVEVTKLLVSGRPSIKNLKNLFSFLLLSSNSTYESWHYIKNELSGSDVVLYSYWMHSGAVAAIDLAKKIRTISHVEKVICRCHRFDLYEYAAPGKYIPMRNYIFSKIDEIHSISADGIGYMRTNFSIDESKLFISRLGTKDHGTNIRIKERILHLVSCSWMRPVKRVSSIVEAISMLSVKVDWVHYGDGEEFSKVQSQIDKLENPNITCTLKGAWKNVDVLKDYARLPYDVFINVSENEGVPVSIMEAMSFGKIIIATDVGGTSEIVKDGVNGYLLPKNFAAKDLALLMTKIAKMDSDTFNDMCLQSRQIWEERCNAKENYTQFYTKLNYSIGQ